MIRLATRGSALALAQSEWVAELLGGAELVAVQSKPDPAPNDKERFVAGVTSAVLAGDADLCVHSAKDLPGDRPEEIRLVGVPSREDPADVYIGPADSLQAIPEGARIGTASLRRRSQLLAVRDDLEVVELRGNVDTRLRKLADGEVDGLVLAAAGLLRLGRGDEIGFRFEPDVMTPSAGQGALALESRREDEESAAAAAAITDAAAIIELTAERSTTATLGADCDSCVGVSAIFTQQGLVVAGYAGTPDGAEWVRDTVAGNPEQPAALGVNLAERMLAAGAGAYL